LSAPHQTTIWGATPPPPQPAAPIELYRQLAAVGARKLADGLSPTREELRAMRELALIDAAPVAWPDRPAAAAELAVSPKQLEKHIAAGCPVPPHSAIPKVPVLLWLLDLYRTQGADQASSAMEDDPTWIKAQEDARWRRLKNDRLEQTMVAEAEATAAETIATVCRELKHALLFAAPQQIIDTLRSTAAHEHEAAIRRTIAEIITDTARAAGGLDDEDLADEAPESDDPTTPPQPPTEPTP
jgi:hypothetical protein